MNINVLKSKKQQGAEQKANNFDPPIDVLIFVCSNMSSIYLFFIAALDLKGIFFNVRMLRCCFKDATKYTFLQQHRSLIIFQCICQGTLPVMDVVESWKGSRLCLSYSWFTFCCMLRPGRISMYNTTTPLQKIQRKHVPCFGTFVNKIKESYCFIVLQVRC